MASGTKQHVGLTLLSTNKEEDGLTAKFDQVTHKGGIMGDVVTKVNGAIGNRALFNSYEEANNLPLEKTEGWGLVKAVDAYADWFMSKDKGCALMADAGLDIVKLESKNVHLGLGFRADTGINVGRQGARGTFFGTGGELIFEELPVPATCTSRGKDGEEAPKAEEEKPWYKDVKIRGFGVQWIFFKVRVMWA
eukprot:scaffold47775_cov57-Phaeocystis_antarctica.AAC.1